GTLGGLHDLVSALIEQLVIVGLQTDADAWSGHGPSQSLIFVTTPAPTVLPPSRIAKRRPCSHAIGVTSSTSTVMLSPGITISVPCGSVTVPVTSVVRK